LPDGPVVGCGPRECSEAPVAESQSLTVQSSDADSTSLPSGENATAWAQPEWPSSVCSEAPITASRVAAAPHARVAATRPARTAATPSSSPADNDDSEQEEEEEEELEGYDPAAALPPNANPSRPFRGLAQWS